MTAPQKFISHAKIISCMKYAKAAGGGSFSQKKLSEIPDKEHTSGNTGVLMQSVKFFIQSEFKKAGTGGR